MLFQNVDIGYASDVLVMALTHTGEPGYCLYVPSEYALHVYDRLITVSFLIYKFAEKLLI